MAPRPVAKHGGGEDGPPQLSQAEKDKMEKEAFDKDNSNAEVDKGIDISWHAKIFVESIIVINAIQLGACVNPDELPQIIEFCSVSEHIFIVIFCIEAIFRIYNQRLDYFKVRWNQFDFVLTTMAVLDNWILNPLLNVTKSPISNIYILRLIRLLRILRILKVLRSQRELQMLMEGLVGALKSMVWVATLLGFLIYVSAIICVTLFSKVESDYALTFNTIPQAIFTLFSLAIVADWTDIVMPVIEEYPWAGLGFVMFTVVASFGILNLIIGVISERTTMVQREYEAHTQYGKDLARMKSIENIAHIVFDRREDGTITQGELEELMNSQDHGPMIMTLIGSVQLPLGFTILDLHPMFDRDASGSINRDEFIQGMKRLIFSNAFQRTCLLQSSIADVLVEVKCVEERLGHLMDKEFVSLREEVKLAGNFAGGGVDGGTGGGGDGAAAEMTGGEAAEGDHTKTPAATPAEEKTVEAATAILQPQTILPHGGLSVHEAMRHQKELKALSSKLLVRLTEPMVQLLTEGLQAEVWADISPTSIASDLAKAQQHAHHVARHTPSAAEVLHDTFVGVENTDTWRNSAVHEAFVGAGSMRSASSQISPPAQGPLPVRAPRPREAQQRQRSRGGISRESSDFGAPLGGPSPSTASAWSMKNTMGQQQHSGDAGADQESESDDFVNVVRTALSSSSLNARRPPVG